MNKGINFEQPAVVFGGIGTGVHFTVKQIISEMVSKNCKVFVITPTGAVEYRDIADEVVYAKIWLKDGKYRFPAAVEEAEYDVTLIDFEGCGTAENITEVIGRIGNLIRCSETEKAVVILDSYIDAENIAALLEIRSGGIAVVWTEKNASEVEECRNNGWNIIEVKE
jgi:hypothetical protein